MSEPELSVVVASVNGMPYLGACLDALERHCPDAEVIVADWTDEETRRTVAERFPSVRLLSFSEPMTVPELRAAGIFAARAPYVAVIEDHCNVTPGWAERILAAHRAGYSVVGGPVRNVVTGRARDWAAFLCEYSNYLEPSPSGAVNDLPGMNVSYDRRAIDAIEDLLRAGHWESWLHPRLLERGFELHSLPDAPIEHAKDFDFGEFSSQRYHYARSFAGTRNQQLGGRRVLYALGTPLLVPLTVWRIGRNVARRPRFKGVFVRSLPLILTYATVWAAGESVGYTLGGGRSLLRVR
jgi:glycosyltransferase involved in cell wall biosynthesis